MNAIINFQNQLEEQFLNTVDASNFSRLYMSHVDFFKENLLAGFQYYKFSERTARAQNPLQSFDDLTSYMAFYGLAHYQRMRHLLNMTQQQSQFSLDNPVKANIVDYGCGQGIATLAFIDHLLESKHHIAELDITLIEPSPIALRRAIYWIEKKAKAEDIKINITAHACTFDELAPDFLAKNAQGYPYIHFFSNILDMYHQGKVSLYALSQQIKQRVGQHFVFATSPDFYSGNIGFDKLHQLLMPRKTYVNHVEDIKIDEFRSYYQNPQTRLVSMRAYAIKL